MGCRAWRGAMMSLEDFQAGWQVKEVDGLGGQCGQAAVEWKPTVRWIAAPSLPPECAGCPMPLCFRSCSFCKALPD